MIDWLLAFLEAIAIHVISFLGLAFLVWILAKCFGFLFTWKLAFNIWISCLAIINILFNIFMLLKD